MRGQHRADGADVENVGVRAAIEDLRSERMGDGNDGDFRLLTQGEAKPKGTMRCEIADQDIRQRLVIVGIVILRIRGLTTRFAVWAGSFVHGSATTLPFAALVPRFRFRLLVLGPHETAFNPQRPVMVEDDKGPAPRDIGGVVGQTLRLTTPVGRRRCRAT